MNNEGCTKTRRHKNLCVIDDLQCFVMCFLYGIIIGVTMKMIALGHCGYANSRFYPKRKNDYVFQRINKEVSQLSRENVNLIFVGVMVDQNNLDSRISDMTSTWTREISGEIAFFVGENSSAKLSAPLIKIHGTDDSYPPYKKSFLMLKYMYDHCLEKFEYFLRIEDTAYIRPDLLENLLRSVNSSEVWLIGQSGQGLPEERSKLALLDNENYCLGGPGMIISQAALKLIGPKITECLKHLHSPYEDVEVSRCFTRFANISCTRSYEVLVQTNQT